MEPINAGVAQLAEQLICNQQVVGSIPITSSNIIYGQIPERPKGADCKSADSVYDGSNPSLPTKTSTYCACFFMQRCLPLRFTQLYIRYAYIPTIYYDVHARKLAVKRIYFLIIIMTSLRLIATFKVYFV